MEDQLSQMSKLQVNNEEFYFYRDFYSQMNEK